MTIRVPPYIICSPTQGYDDSLYTPMSPFVMMTHPTGVMMTLVIQWVMMTPAHVHMMRRLGSPSPGATMGISNVIETHARVARDAHPKTKKPTKRM